MHKSQYHQGLWRWSCQRLTSFMYIFERFRGLILAIGKQFFCRSEIHRSFYPEVWPVQHLLPQVKFFTTSVHPVSPSALMLSLKTKPDKWSTEPERMKWLLPLPKLNLIPPKMSLWPIRSWSQTVSSKLLSQSSMRVNSSQVSADSHLGDVVFRQTGVFCFIPLLFSGNR